MTSTDVDAVVIGAGHNGLVAAAVLADAGWDVQVLEAQPDPGGAVRSAELTPGYITDLFSAFHPMAVVSPALAALHLEDHGLRWSHAPAVVGHPRSPDDTNAPLLHRDVLRTAAALDDHTPGDGDSWLALFDLWRSIKAPLLRSLFAPFPPLRGPLGLLRSRGVAGTLRLARLLLLPATVMGEQLFAGEAARLLLMGNAMHADIPVDAPGSGMMGFLLSMLAQDDGWPVPTGGSGQLTTALMRRARAAGAEVHTSQPVSAIEVRDGVAVAVQTSGGGTIRVRRAVIADTSAPTLFGQLLPAKAIPASLRDQLDGFVWDTPVVKVNYALSAPISWHSPNLRDAGTVHLGADRNGLIRWMADLNTASVPERPFLLLGQMTTADPTRSPEGTESAWAYTHLPRDITDDASAETLAQAVDRVIEAHAPGFGAAILDRVVQRPSDLQASDANLHGGAVNGGTAQLFQQMLFRPYPVLGRAETPIERLYLGSAATHPGGSVHGVCGYHAAAAALANDGRRGWPRRTITRTVVRTLSR
jgi:phytoene dehydrogenase-like protein